MSIEIQLNSIINNHYVKEDFEEYIKKCLEQDIVAYSLVIVNDQEIKHNYKVSNFGDYYALLGALEQQKMTMYKESNSEEEED